MPDLLTHILVGYTLATALSWRIEWVTPPLVTVAMTGAILPDLTRIELLVPGHIVEDMLGLPFSWAPLHRVGGTAVVIGIGAVLAPRRWRRRVALLLLLGASTHYALDFLLYKPTGMTGDLLWPLIGHGFQIDGVYLSSDRWPAATMIVIAGVVWALNRLPLAVSRDTVQTADSSE